MSVGVSNIVFSIALNKESGRSSYLIAAQVLLKYFAFGHASHEEMEREHVNTGTLKVAQQYRPSFHLPLLSGCVTFIGFTNK